MNGSIRTNVLRGARLRPPAGWSVWVYDSEQTPCRCTTALASGVPAVPVAVERVRPRRRRRCLVCGTAWSLNAD
jgi:3-oxoacyl-(acyl-carrier-protein) synthase